MYYVVYASGATTELHVCDGSSDGSTLIENLRSKIHQVVEIQADGHELEAIQRKFTINGHCTVPMPSNRVCNWYGDLAKTIHAGLLSHKGFGV